MSDIVRKNFSLQPEEWERWEKEIEERDFTTESAFIRAMVEAGLKKFERPVDPDESLADLREHRNDLKRELDRTRGRVERLEEQLFHTDQAAAARYLQENPEAGFDAVLNHLEVTLPRRLTRFFDELEAAGGDPEAMERSAKAQIFAQISQDYAEKEWDEGRPDPHPDEPEGER